MDGLSGSSENAQKLHGRLTTNARKLAGLLALINGEHQVGAQAVKSAIAWVSYGSKTIDVVASTIEARKQKAHVRKLSEKVWRTIGKRTAIHPDTRETVFPTRKVIQQTLSLKADDLTLALGYLSKQAPPLLRIHEKLTGNNRVTAFLEAIGEWR